MVPTIDWLTWWILMSLPTASTNTSWPFVVQMSRSSIPSLSISYCDNQTTRWVQCLCVHSTAVHSPAGQNTPEIPRDSHSQSRINQQSQITSTQRIMSSTVTRQLSSAHESDRTTRWIREAVKIRQESQGIMNRDEGPTSWATSMTTYCSS